MEETWGCGHLIERDAKGAATNGAGFDVITKTERCYACCTRNALQILRDAQQFVGYLSTPVCIVGSGFKEFPTVTTWRGAVIGVCTNVRVTKAFCHVLNGGGA